MAGTASVGRLYRAFRPGAWPGQDVSSRLPILGRSRLQEADKECASGAQGRRPSHRGERGSGAAGGRGRERSPGRGGGSAGCGLRRKPLSGQPSTRRGQQTTARGTVPRGEGACKRTSALFQGRVPLPEEGAPGPRETAARQRAHPFSSAMDAQAARRRACGEGSGRKEVVLWPPKPGKGPRADGSAEAPLPITSFVALSL